MSMLLRWFWGDDKDEEGIEKYDKFSSFLKRGYLSLPIPGTDRMITLPNPHGFGAFYGLGNIVHDVAVQKKDLVTGMGEMFDTFQSSLLPLDMGSLFARDGGLSPMPIVPTMLVPFVAIPQNENFAGMMIHRDKYTPDQNIANSQLYLKNTNKLVKGFTDFLYKLGGGDTEMKYKTYYDDNGKFRKVWLDINPANLEYLITYYTSGKGQFYNGLYKSIIQPISDGLSKTVEAETPGGKTVAQAYKELFTTSPEDIPVLNRFLRSGKGDPIQKEYYEKKKDLEGYLTQLNQYTKMGRAADMGRMMGDEKYQEARNFKEKQKIIDDLNERLYMDLSPEARKQIMDQIRTRKKEILNYQPNN
jgi:hypothetical protein